MRMNLRVNLWNVFFFHLFTFGSTSKCYYCKERNQTECIAKQKVKNCEGKCMTAAYSELRGDRDEPYYVKVCWKKERKKDCNTFCTDYKSSLVSNCDVIHCCTGDYCNERFIDKKNQKRSTVGAGISSTDTIYKNGFFSFSALMTCTLLVHHIIL